MKKRKNRNYKILSPPINYWFIATISLSIIIIIFLLLLIKERQFLVNMNIYLDKYRLKINSFANNNAKITASHLSFPTTPFSSSNIIYLTPKSYTYKNETR